MTDEQQRELLAATTRELLITLDKCRELQAVNSDAWEIRELEQKLECAQRENTILDKRVRNQRTQLRNLVNARIAELGKPAVDAEYPTREMLQKEIADLQAKLHLSDLNYDNLDSHFDRAKVRIRELEKERNAANTKLLQLEKAAKK